MPLTSKGIKILASMREQYGDKKGKEVFYKSINAGKIKGAEASKHSKKQRDAAKKMNVKI